MGGPALRPPTAGPSISIIVPVHREGAGIEPFLDRLFENVLSSCEVLVVYDNEDDETVSYLKEYERRDPRVRPCLNTYGPGPANAIRYGLDRAAAGISVVTMADGSDDSRQIDELARLVERGVVVAAASRYAQGGKQVGGPFVKRILSRLAGRSLYWFARVGTRDATNSFKGYSTEFVRSVGIESRTGFEIGLELTAKAKRLRLPVAEIPTIWLDRQTGVSNFKVAAWIPYYLKWYRFAFGPRLKLEDVRKKPPSGAGSDVEQTGLG